MLDILIGVIIVLFLLGAIGHIGGSLIYLLLVVLLVVGIIRLMEGRR